MTLTNGSDTSQEEIWQTWVSFEAAYGDTLLVPDADSAWLMAIGLPWQKRCFGRCAPASAGVMARWPASRRERAAAAAFAR